ncbi:prepilin-type N-terminal cleavage/methylation domain-containing protein [Rubritalea squalenifaciens DSM 18772]|uniref:Prepilin-type N-terminal cleavage/methylation domain-containing protein n=2 Tax=Rubritalea squalenifaciens TaxID=407226 RepID=A0A1M6H1G3_9BACT|nr:prepilin-type N-terminal cleavage/methylation domain-containing protein [Rubritalea squalenifaciens DSM 18772]
MTSALRTNRLPIKKAHSGFTLLELIITLALISVLMGSAFFAFSANTSDEIIETQGAIEATATSTLRRSSTLGRPHYAIIRHDAIWVTELIDQTADLSRIQPSSDIALVDIPEGTILSCKRENGEWVTMTEREDPVIWVFARSGICEVFSFRLEDGGSSFEMTVNPITGNFIDLDEEANQ